VGDVYQGVAEVHVWQKQILSDYSRRIINKSPAHYISSVYPSYLNKLKE
jgi:hypothetical protein